MQKKDLIIVAVLIGLMMLWGPIDQKIIKPMFFKQPITEQVAEPSEAASPEVVTEQTEQVVNVTAPEEIPGSAVPENIPETTKDIVTATEPEQTVVISNSGVAITISSHGAGILSAKLSDYRKSIDSDESVFLDFADRPALIYTGLSGMSPKSSFAIQQAENEVVLSHQTDQNLTFSRSISFENKYSLKVVDELSNTGNEAVNITNLSIQLGPMRQMDDFTMRGMIFLGVDSLSPGGGKVQHYGKKIKKFFKDTQEIKQLLKFPTTINFQPHLQPVDWVCAKNKYFTQLLAPVGGAQTFRIYAQRELMPQELLNPSFIPKRVPPISTVSASLFFDPLVIPPGETNVLEYHFYIGPKKFQELAKQGVHQIEVMEFGRMGFIGKPLLKLMNWIHDVLWPHNYGVAIMLLTILIRIVFWPITHKGTQSMKRMQELQPLMNEIKEKYKDNAQKQQQAIMALYKEHKVNPVGGCLPMLIQIPVFIALFVVLRSAIELRFAPFLWINDLSRPENLLAGVLPIPLNILPLIMAATMFWQQRLSPGAGDSQQQKMMAFMPVMMLVMFYNMASGLVLYWTTSQCLMIAQQLISKRKSGSIKTS